MAKQTESSTKMKLRSPAVMGRGRAAKSKSKVKPELLWAVDPTEPDSEFTRRVAKVASIWGAAYDTEVTPISVISRANVPWPEDMTMPLKEVLMPAAYHHVEDMIQKAKVKNVGEPRFLVERENTGSRRAAVRTLAEAARRLKAAAIVVATHGPRPLDRIRMGGFTENLIAMSTVPVVVVNPRMEAPKRIRRILLPTDFSDESRRVFKIVIDLAARWGASIELFHVNDLALRSLSFVGEWGMSLDPVLITEAWNEEEKIKKKAAASWKEMAIRRGVECECSFISSGEGLSHAILYAEQSEDTDMTAMTTYAGPIEQVILGSVARDVIHGATKPVLVVRGG